jgi:dihydropteroate synthase
VDSGWRYLGVIAKRLRWSIVGAAVSAFGRGATILRAHDVREHVEALTVASAVAG